MLRGLWNRIMRQPVEREAEREHMSAGERHYTAESVEDHQADEFVEEHLGGREPDFGEDDRPRS
jgi:hypothetical protein